MTIDYDISLDDIVLAQVYHNLDSPVYRWHRLAIRFGTPLFTLIVAFLAPAKNRIGYLILVMAALFWSILFFRKTARRVTERVVISKSVEGLFRDTIGHHTLQVLPSWISDTTNEGETKLVWSEVESIIKTKEEIFIHTNNSTYHIIPMKAFNSRIEFDNFYSLLLLHKKQFAA